MKSLILVVDDEHIIADSLAKILDLAGYESVAAYSAAEANAVLETKTPALLITDVVMPAMNGVDLAIRAREQCPEVKILLVSGNAITQTVTETARLRGYDFEVMAKPVPPAEMLEKVAGMLRAAEAKDAA
jgi:DNA-binding NtrC family response regulator